MKAPDSMRYEISAGASSFKKQIIYADFRLIVVSIALSHVLVNESSKINVIQTIEFM